MKYEIMSIPLKGPPKCGKPQKSYLLKKKELKKEKKELSIFRKILNISNAF